MIEAWRERSGSLNIRSLVQRLPHRLLATVSYTTFDYAMYVATSWVTRLLSKGAVMIAVRQTRPSLSLPPSPRPTTSHNLLRSTIYFEPGSVVFS